MTTEVPKGEYPLAFGPSVTGQRGLTESTRKRKRDLDQLELVGVRYAFKPASVTHETPGTYHPDAGIGANGQIVFDTAGGSQQTFDVREEHSKGNECVLMFDQGTQSFTLHTLPSTLHLTLNRSSSHRRPASVISSTSSSSVRLSQRQTRAGHDDVDADADRSPPHDAGASVEVDDDTPRPKRSRPSEASSVPVRESGRATKGGKGLPRKKPLESAPIPVLSAPPRNKAKATGTGTGTGKGKAKAAPKPKPKPKGKGAKGKAAARKAPEESAKFKSSEYIDDSDEEIAGSQALPTDDGDGEGEMDEFASLLGQSLAQDDNDDEDEEEEESEDDDALGGARLVVSSAGGGGGRAAQGTVMMEEDDDTEWI